MFCLNSRLLFTLLLFLPVLGQAEESSSKWEFVLAATGASIPYYRGSNQQLNVLIPVPYFQYEGKLLKVDREGGRLYLYKGKRFWLDLTANLDIPINGSQARQSMPDLYPLIEFGPRAVFDLYHNSDDSLRIRAAFPLFMVLATDFQHTSNIGLVFPPYLQIRYYTGWETALSMGPTYASDAFHDYFYAVDPQYATPTRPAYNAQAGYSGFRFTLTSTHRFSKHYFLGAAFRYDLLDGAVFANSPLVTQKDNFTMGLVFAWIYDF